jgi:hypothetical protein
LGHEAAHAGGSAHAAGVTITAINSTHLVFIVRLLDHLVEAHVADDHNGRGYKSDLHECVVAASNRQWTNMIETATILRQHVRRHLGDTRQETS